MMARRMMRKHHVRCRAGEKVEITSKPYLSLSVIEEVGRAMIRGGYKIKVLNTIDFSCSMHYNPFVYLHSETDILTLVTVIMTNTQGEAKGGDDFWQKAEALLYQALIAYIYYEAPAEEKNMNTLLDMLNACECREDDENFKSAVDLLFEQLENRNPDHFAVRQYKNSRWQRARP